MITGVETAGLVLGAFPIIIKFIQKYKEGLQPLRDWFGFCRVLEELDQAVGVQSTYLSAELQQLWMGALRSVEKASSVMIELRRYSKQQSRHNGNIDSALESSLKDYLGNSYQAYLKTLGHVLEKIKDFQSLMNLEGEEQAAFLQSVTSRSGFRSTTRQDIMSQWDKLQIVRRKPDLLSLLKKIEDLNDDLRGLRKRGREVLEMEGLLLEDAVGEKLVDFKSKADYLYSFFGSIWPCNCPSASHDVRTFLQVSADGQKNDVQSNEEPHCTFKISLSLRKAERPSLPIIWQHTSISVIRLNRSHPQSRDNPIALTTKRTHQRISSAADFLKEASLEEESICRTLRDPSIFKQSVWVWKQHEHALFCHSTTESIQDGNIDPDAQALSDILTSGIESQSNQRRRRLRHSRRKRLAARAALLFTHVYHTAWYRKPWCRRELKFLPRTHCRTDQSHRHREWDNFDMGNPLLEHRFPSVAAARSGPLQNSNEDAEQALVQLGVLLEEICYWEVLENQKIYSECSMPDGPDRVRLAAGKWAKDVLDRMGTLYHAAVLACFDLSLKAAAYNTRRAEFWQAVYDGIVLPLQKSCEGSTLIT